MKIVSFDEYVKEICKNCINKNTDLCEIHRTIDNSVSCAYLTVNYQDTKDKEE